MFLFKNWFVKKQKKFIVLKINKVIKKIKNNESHLIGAICGIKKYWINQLF